MLKVGEFFSGYGSQSLSLKYLNIEHEVVCTSEIDIDAILSYGVLRFNLNEDTNVTNKHMIKYLKNRNIGVNLKTNKCTKIDKLDDVTLRKLYNATIKANNFGDISLIEPNVLPDMDLMTYSFPCVAISRAGKMEGMKENSNTKSSLIHECKKIIHMKKPKYLLMENVSDLICKKHIDDFNDWIQWLNDEGYVSNYKVMKGSDYGIPQNRERVFMVSILNGKEFEFPIENKNSIILSDLLEKDIKMYKYHDVMNGIVDKECPFTDKYLNLIHEEDDEIRIKQNVKKGYIVFNPKNGIGVCDLSYPTSKLRRGRVQNDGDYCPTLTASSQALCVLDKELNFRKFTNREEFRLMGMKDEDIDKLFTLNLKYDTYHKLAGNSIVINCLNEIFSKLLIE